MVGRIFKLVSRKKRKERARWTRFVNAADPLEIKLWLQLVQNISKVDF